MQYLSELQKRMLVAEVFHLDGWNSRRGWEAAMDLKRRGYVEESITQESQYTAHNFKVTPTGSAAIGKTEE